MNRVQALNKALGQSSKTIEEIAEITGVPASELLYGEATSKHLTSEYTGGWFAGRTCSLEFNLQVNFPKNVGNKDFWIGVAEGLMLEWVLSSK